MLGRNINSNTLSGINRDNVNQQLIETIQEEILVIETDIDLLKQEQIEQNQNIATNQSNISTNTGNIAVNTTAISALQSEQIIQNQNISVNTQNINLNSIDIDDLESEQVIQNSAILANTNAISQNTTSINTLQGQLNGFQSNTLQELIDISADLTALQTTVTQNKTATDNEFSDIRQQLVDLDIRITQNRQDIDQNFLYIEIIMTSIYYNKNEIDNQFLQLRGTWTGSISELKNGLDDLIAGLTVRMGQAEANITGLQGRMLTEEQQTALQWSAISDLQVFDTSLQNQINSNNTTQGNRLDSIEGVNTTQDSRLTTAENNISGNSGAISTLQTKTQNITANVSTTNISGDLSVSQNITCNSIFARGTIAENPALLITDEASGAIMSFDSFSLNAQGNPIIEPGDSIIVSSNSNESGVLTLSQNSTTRAGVRITKDQTTISGNTLNIRNSDNNVMTSTTRATSDSAILAHHGNIHTNSIRHRSIFVGIAVVGSINSSYASITPLISSMTNFTPTNTNFFVINPGFKIETYSGTNYTGNQNVFNNGLGNFTITVAAIGSIQSIKLFFRNMNGSETQILL